MSQHTFISPPDGNQSPKDWYQANSKTTSFVQDSAQAAAIEKLDVLWHQLLAFKSKRNHFLGRSLLSPDVPKGLYFWGGVGRGKTFLMDMFYASVPYRRKRRIHFHNFMAEVHHEMKLLADKNDPLIALSDTIAKSTRLLCLDEFHVDDIADAMILGRLLGALFERGVILITTSNHAPDGLYPNGLQRQRFLPTIALLKQQLDVMNVDSGNDYRLREMAREPLFLTPADAQCEQHLMTMFERYTAGDWQHEGNLAVCSRVIPTKKLARNAVWFNFSELCGGAHGQNDYLEIAHQFPIVFLSNIPIMSAETAAAARRFTWLVDVFYDNNVKLVATAAAVFERLYDASLSTGESERIVSRLIEMQSKRYLELPHHTQGVSLN